MRLGATDRWRIIYRALSISQGAITLFIGLVGAAQKYKIPEQPTLWSVPAKFVQDHAIVILLILTLLVWAASAVKACFGNPVKWDMVKDLLEELHDDVFANQPTSACHDRVTLFMKKDYRWFCGFIPSSDWLCTVERTGHMTRKRRRWFRVKDNGETLEGVAGQVFGGGGETILKDNLPLLTETSPTKVIDNYAKSTFVDVAYVRRQLRKKSPLPRSICGILVEVKNRPWGVIVIDSLKERLQGRDQIDNFYKKNAKMLGRLLERL